MESGGGRRAGLPAPSIPAMLGSTPPTAPAGPACPATSSSSSAGTPSLDAIAGVLDPTASGHGARINSFSDLAADPDTGRPVAALDRLDDTLAYRRAADEQGLDVFTLGEHHSQEFAVAGPAVVLATIAGQTGADPANGGVTVLSFLDAVRLYQDFAQLDLVSHGPAEIIAGRSAFAEPFERFGAPMAEYDELFGQKLTCSCACARSTDHLTAPRRPPRPSEFALRR
jgi:hypothetical protein